MNSSTAATFPILVHSHLRWDWVWQRPQQFVSRLSKAHPILFVEEPAGADGLTEPRATLREVADFPNILILRTEYPWDWMGNRERLDAEQRRLVKGLIARQLPPTFARPVQWFYDPMASSAFLGQMDELANVYDCMDQLSQFRGAPPELVRRERELLTRADVVFAGGPKIHAAKRLLNANCHCYGCGVDVQHFGQALDTATIVPEEIAQLSGPKLGYFGVVDERLDYSLLSRVAAAHPEWHVVVIGPTAKVDPAAFPQHANLHWLGGRDYTQLPAYVKGFDLCLMPFALNEATEFINPTKALEYMATGTPIVSTPIEDVVAQFSEVVHLAHTPEAFVATCERILQAPDLARIEASRRLADRNSWDAIVADLEAHVSDALSRRDQSRIAAA